ncbi:MAG: cobalamin-dependent protein, partial [Phycisphaerales bacterium]|nr:cobalamin-dependent protein [Phycisphaerales bacterium]
MRIGLLAMSGVRAHDEKLMAFGLTLPGFVERSKVIASLPSLGLLYLAAVTPGVAEGRNEVRYFEAEGDGKEPEEIYQCDLVGISTFSAQVFEAYAIADRLRARGVKVAMGGLHVTALPEEAAEHADYAVVGEGEKTWPEVVRVCEGELGRTLRKSGRIFRAKDFGVVGGGGG